MAFFLGTWTFALFLYYRIITAAGFGETLSLIACLLTAVVSTGIIFFTTGFYAVAHAKSQVKRLSGMKSGPLTLAVGMPLLLATSTNVLFGFAIALGFSERFYDQITRYSYRRGVIEEEWLWFIIVLAIPVITHFAITMHGMKSMSESKNEMDER